MAQYDGSVKISVNVDTKNFNKSTRNMSKEFGEGTRSINKGVSAVKNSMSALGGVIAATFSVTAIMAFSNEASKMASQAEASAQRLKDIYGGASQAVGDFIDANARAMGMSRSAAASYAAVYGNLFGVWADTATNAELTKEYLNMTAVVASKTSREVSDVQERIRSGLLGNTEAIEDLGIFVNIKTIEITESFKRMANGKSWEQLDAYAQQQIRTMAILEQATAKYGTEVADTGIMARMQFQAAYQDFQATWGQVVNTVLIPILEVGTRILDVFTQGLQVIAGLSGKTIETTDEQSSSIESAVGNQKDLTKAIKDTEKAQQGALAGFDEINTLTKDTANGSGGSGGSGVGKINIKPKKGKDDDGKTIIKKVDKTLAAIMTLIGGALAAVGIILICTGHIALGISFLIAGAFMFVTGMAALSEGEEEKKVRNMISAITAIVSGALLVIGIILCASGVGIPIGVGMIIAGVAGLIATVALNWDFVKEKINSFLNNEKLMKSFLVIGVILLFCPAFLPLSLGLIATGALGLAKQNNISWDMFKEKIKKIFTEIGDWLKILGTLVLGVILCVSGVGLPIGIALIASGAGDFIDKASIYWDTYGDKIKEIFNGILNWVKTWGLLILGIILCVSGVGLPLGLALIKKGGANLTEAQDPLWNAILDKVKDVWNKIKNYWNTNIAKYFTAAWWGNLGKNAIKGFVNYVIDGINKLISSINSFGFNMPDVLGGGRIGFKIPKIPRLAQGAVIPPNREFLAVLGDQRSGTNIEAPLDTIKQAVAEVLTQINVGGANKSTIIVPLYINGREVARAVRESESEMGTQTVFGGFANAY